MFFVTWWHLWWIYCFILLTLLFVCSFMFLTSANKRFHWSAKLVSACLRGKRWRGYCLEEWPRRPTVKTGPPAQPSHSSHSSSRGSIIPKHSKYCERKKNRAMHSRTNGRKNHALGVFSSWFVLPYTVDGDGNRMRCIISGRWILTGCEHIMSLPVTIRQVANTAINYIAYLS